MTGQDADTRLDCQVEQRGHAIVVSVAGAVDLTTQGIFADAVAEALRGRAAVVVIDLADVKFMSSPGLAVLVDAHENAMRAHKVVHVAIGTGVVKRSIDVTGLGEILSLVPDVQTALER